MSFEETKEYLSSIRYLSAEIDAIDLQIYRMRRELLAPPGGGSLTSSISPDGIRSRKTYAWSEANINAYLDLISKQEGKIAQRTGQRDKITAEIEMLESPRDRAILYERYVNGSGWGRIADHLSYDEDYVRTTLHYMALEAFEKKFIQNLHP